MTVSNCSSLFLVTEKPLKELLNHVKHAAPRALPRSDKNAQKLLLAVTTQIIAVDSFCWENIYTSAVRQELL